MQLGIFIFCSSIFAVLKRCVLKYQNRKSHKMSINKLINFNQENFIVNEPFVKKNMLTLISYAKNTYHVQNN